LIPAVNHGSDRLAGAHGRGFVSILRSKGGETVESSNDAAGERSYHIAKVASQKQEWDIAKQIVFTNRFLPLPSKFEVYEWAIIQDFSHSFECDN
jgi:hypothetical protein